MRNRDGFSLMELLIAITILAILGAGVTRMLVHNSRYVTKLDAMMDARQAARAAMHTVAVELRMVSTGGLIAADVKSVTARIPYAWGMTCDMETGDRIASLVPTDSMMFASATADGMAYRGITGGYTFITGITVAPSTATTACDDADNVKVVPGGSLIAITGGDPVAAGSLFYLYELVQYSFAPSIDLPGRTGLWRQAGTRPNEELIAPFDTAAGFAFLVGSALAVQDTVPALLSQVRGLELRLLGSSEATPQGSTDPEVFDLRSTVLFLNTIQ